MKEIMSQLIRNLNQAVIVASGCSVYFYRFIDEFYIGKFDNQTIQLVKN